MSKQLEALIFREPVVNLHVEAIGVPVTVALFTVLHAWETILSEKKRQRPTCNDPEVSCCSRNNENPLHPTKQFLFAISVLLRPAVFRYKANMPALKLPWKSNRLRVGVIGNESSGVAADKRSSELRSAAKKTAAQCFTPSDTGTHEKLWFSLHPVCSETLATKKLNRYNKKRTVRLGWFERPLRKPFQ